MGAAVLVLVVVEGFFVDFFGVVFVDVFVAPACVVVVFVPAVFVDAAFVAPAFVDVVFVVLGALLVAVAGSPATGFESATAPAGVTLGFGRPAFWAAARRSATTH